MSDTVKKTIEIPEVTRVEGHAAVEVDIADGKVSSVKLEVFEGTRFFEKIVVGHQFHEMPHITSRVCAICSAGHVLASIFALEHLMDYKAPERVRFYRELMHLGMIIESHATHLYALALPDFVGAKDLIDFATNHPVEFGDWTRLRNLGSAIQTIVGGRPFHPVNLQVGGFSHYPGSEPLLKLYPEIAACKPLAIKLCEFLIKLDLKFGRTSVPTFVALVPDRAEYGYFGTRVRSTKGWEEPISEYQNYLNERVVPYSHAKRTTAKGENMMVGSMARLLLFGDRLTGEARLLYTSSAIAKGDTNTVWNNVGQAVELVQALDRVSEIIDMLTRLQSVEEAAPLRKALKDGTGVGAVECPRGTLYHSYTLDEHGTVRAADLVTPSVQNTGRIELDIHEIVETTPDVNAPALQTNLETVIRAYDPCNTCATHMVTVKYTNAE